MGEHAVSVGVRELKNRLSEYLRRVAGGERVVVTDRGRPIATIAPIEETDAAPAAWRLVTAGVATWRGGKPVGLADGPIPRGGSVADAVIEDRR
jgi:prevent-host-death family protein